MGRKRSINVFGKADHNVAIYILIGQLIVHWANNESVFLRILHGLMGATLADATTAFHSHKNTMGRLDLIVALGNGKISDDKLKAELASLVSQFKGLSRTRNFFAHSMFDYDDELRLQGATGIIFDNKNQVFVQEAKAFTPATINEINDANTRATALNRDLRAQESPPSAPTSGE
jgi:hypothetical protein